jgi:predicted Holliday junction resolvase-like endonuclease
LCKSRSWLARKQTRLKATLVDLVFYEGLEEDEIVKQHFVEAMTMQTWVGEENIVEEKVQPSTEVQVMAKAQ